MVFLRIVHLVDVFNETANFVAGNYEKASTSESESPTEPLTQHIAANLG